MKNTITIEIEKSRMKKQGDKIVLSLNADELKNIFGKQRQLKDVKVGDTFSVDGEEFIVLEQGTDTTAVLRKDLLPDRKFDNNSCDWESSSLREYLNGEYLNNLAEKVGKSNIVEHTSNLLSDDGSNYYGNCKDIIGLLSCDQLENMLIF